MKFKVGDTVLITSGKEKGKKGEITRVLPQENTVVVKGMNLFTRHVKPMAGRSGQKVVSERPLSVAKVAHVNEAGVADRIGFTVAKDGTKVRIFKKSGVAVAEKKQAKK